MWVVEVWCGCAWQVGWSVGWDKAGQKLREILFFLLIDSPELTVRTLKNIATQNQGTLLEHTTPPGTSMPVRPRHEYSLRDGAQWWRTSSSAFVLLVVAAGQWAGAQSFVVSVGPAAAGGGVVDPSSTSAPAARAAARSRRRLGSYRCRAPEGAGGVGVALRASLGDEEDEFDPVRF